MANNNKSKETNENLSDDVKRVRTNFSDITERLIDISRTAYAAKNAEIQAEALKLYRELLETVEESKLAAKGTVEKAESKIGERPFLSVLLAFLVGLLISSLFEGKPKQDKKTGSATRTD